MPTPHARAAVLRRRAGVEPIWIPVGGSSMGRTILAGGRVLVQAVDRPPVRGELWAFDDGDTVVVHRHRSTHDGRHWFRGDANERDDRPVPSTALIGRVVRIEDGRGARDVGRWDRTRGRLRLDADSVMRRWRGRRRRP